MKKAIVILMLLISDNSKFPNIEYRIKPNYNSRSIHSCSE